MNLFAILTFFAEAPDFNNMYLPGFSTQDMPTNFDFIDFYTGQKNLTHEWNKYGLRTELVMKLRTTKSLL